MRWAYLYQRIYGRQNGRYARYNKQEDALLLPLLKELCSARVMAIGGSPHT